MLEQIAPWITPALLVGLFAWLRHDVLRLRQDLRHAGDGLRREMNARMDGFDERLRALGASQGELMGKLTFIENYILGRNEPGAAPAE